MYPLFQQWRYLNAHLQSRRQKHAIGGAIDPDARHGQCHQQTQDNAHIVDSDREGGQEELPAAIQNTGYQRAQSQDERLNKHNTSQIGGERLLSDAIARDKDSIDKGGGEELTDQNRESNSNKQDIEDQTGESPCLYLTFIFFVGEENGKESMGKGPASDQIKKCIRET